METVLGGVDHPNFNNHANANVVEETQPATKTTSSLSSPKLIADPVVYKLVRVEGDGRLVPATEDEIMEVEGLLLDEKGQVHRVYDDTNNTTGACISNEGSSSGIPCLETSEALSHSGNTEAHAELLNVKTEETAPPMALGSDECLDNEPWSMGECLNPLEVSSIHNNSKPDFSKLEGKIYLDNMSIRELHETFKATFGRETSVKDKLWLKRRIAMGLTNSFDISLTTTFIIKDNKLVNEDKDANASENDVEFSENPAHGETKVENHEILFEVEPRNDNLDSNYENGDPDTDQGSKKRVRKPTKRYIEELEEESKENIGKSAMAPSSKISRHRQVSPTSHVKPNRDVLSKRRAVVTRFDSFGGSGVYVPYVCRVRRCRPRKDVTTLVQFHSGGMGPSDALTKDICIQGSQLDIAIESQVLEASVGPKQIQLPTQLIVEIDNNQQSPVLSDGQVQVQQHSEKEEVETSGDTNTTAVTVSPKGGIRRKHHRAWTLTEVLKLVEGVSKYGAGRWSEIKRLAFASYSHRTSVDLKDKWRNLLKASIAQTPSDKGINSRKQASSAPIPATILLRVRELAEMQSQPPPNLNSPRAPNLSSTRSPNISSTRPTVGGGGKSVNKTKSCGYLNEYCPCWVPIALVWYEQPRSPDNLFLIAITVWFRVYITGVITMEGRKEGRKEGY
ncbi:hypothetical protein ACFE04_003785 [Oxalis oulophora]